MMTINAQNVPRQRFQVSLRSLLLVTALVATVLGVVTYLADRPIRPITVQQATQIKPGLSEDRVLAILGSPLRRFEGKKSEWLAFDFHPASGLLNYYLEVEIDSSGRVKSAEQRRYFTHDNMRLAIDPEPIGLDESVSAKK